ncbi:hypothetical protein Tco_0997105 [Tanacetum coccineum]
MAMRTQPTQSPGISARVIEAMTLSPLSFRKRYISSYETPSPSSSPVPSMTLPSRKRYRGTFEPIEDNEVEDTESEIEREESKEEDPGSKGKEAASKDQSVLVQQTADETATHRLPVRTTWEDLMDASLTVSSPVFTPASVEPVDEGFLAELGAEIELHGGAEGSRSLTRVEDGLSRGVG